MTGLVVAGLDGAQLLVDAQGAAPVEARQVDVAHLVQDLDRPAPIDPGGAGQLTRPLQRLARLVDLRHLFVDLGQLEVFVQRLVQLVLLAEHLDQPQARGDVDRRVRQDGRQDLDRLVAVAADDEGLGDDAQLLDGRLDLAALEHDVGHALVERQVGGRRLQGQHDLFHGRGWMTLAIRSSMRAIA